MPAEVQPPELARLLDYQERPRVDDWSLRSALTRYAQPQPQRVGAVLEVVRRIDFSLRPHLKAVEKEGPAIWQALQSPSAGDLVVELLRITMDLDRLGDRLAAWAADPTGERPDADVDAAVATATARLEALGVPREERQRPSGRGRGRG
jgi:hypothetical protein